MRCLPWNAESNFLTVSSWLSSPIHKYINLWLFWLKSRYGCFLVKHLILIDSELSLYGCFNKSQTNPAIKGGVHFP